MEQEETSTAFGAALEAVGLTKEVPYEGVKGLEPFEGAEQDEYKIIKLIDGGNMLEIRGYPQEGYSSNAKVVTAMADVFFSQVLDEILETVSEEKSLTNFVPRAIHAFRQFWTEREQNGGLLGYIGKMTGTMLSRSPCSDIRNISS